MQDKRTSNDWSESCKGHRGEEQCTNPIATPLRRQELRYDDGEGKLYGRGHTRESVTGDELVNALCGAADNGTNETDGVADDEEPAATENVGKSACQQEGDRDGESPCESCPDVVGIRP